jgi:GNAT superfamily N-acetyltransferase
MLDVDAIQAFLARSYWAPGIAKETVAQSLRHSLCFGLFYLDRQIGLARVITDSIRFAYLCDVYVLEAYQGQGLGRWLLQCVLEHPHTRTNRRILLTTQDAQLFYHQLGFRELSHPEHWMERLQAP